MSDTNIELNKQDNSEQIEDTNTVNMENNMDCVEDTAKSVEISDEVAERGRKSAIIFFGVLGIAIISFIIIKIRFAKYQIFGNLTEFRINKRFHKFLFILMI